MVVAVVLIPLVVAAACALPIGRLARPLAVLSGLMTAGSVAAAVWLGIGGGSVDLYYWAAPLGAQLAVGWDGWSAIMLMLSGALFAAGAAASGGVPRPRAYFALWSLLQGAVAGVFVSRDLLLFFASHEALVVPLVLLLWGWGGPDRRAATRRLAAMWLTGSSLLLTGILALGVGAHTFSFAALSDYRLAETSQILLALLFLAAFAMRLPLFPFHAWLVRAYVTAPAPVAVVLAGVISKTAVYAIARICLPLFPRGMADLGPYLLALATVGALYGAILATRQRDTRRVIAYASLAEVDLIAVGVFVATPEGLPGALIASVSHGLLVAILALLAAALARRLGSFGFGPGGLGTRAPVLMALFVLAILGLVGVPGLSGAPGQLLILAAAFAVSPGIGLLASLVPIILAACGAFLLRAVFFGHPAALGRDLGWRERGLVIVLIAIAIVVGVVPRSVADLADRAGPALTELRR
ncbi:MAG TPA: NADH-quinone oxidoreductase subunit M [Candidatus Limnocylindria bacterium]